MANKGHVGDELDFPTLSLEDEASMSDDDQYSSTEDDSHRQSSDHEYENSMRTGPSPSSGVTPSMYSSKAAQVAVGPTDSSDDEDRRRSSRSRGVLSTPRTRYPPGTFEGVAEAQLPVGPPCYTNRIVSTPRRSMKGVEYNPRWDHDLFGKEPEIMEEVLDSSSSGESGDNIEEENDFTPQPEVILTDTHLGHDIVVTHPVTYEIQDRFACRPWPLDRRILEGVEINLEFQEVTCCEVYEVYIKGGKRGVLQFKDEDREHITFSVRIKHLFRSGRVTYVARINQGTRWESVAAELQDENVTFSTTELESMYVICFPTKSRYILQKEGLEISANSEGDKLLFPPNFVDRSETASIQITDVDKEGMDERNKLYPELFKLKALSRRVYVEHDIVQISKAMRAELSLETLGAKNYNVKDLEMICFRWKDGDVTLMSPEECKAKMVTGSKVATQTNGLVNKSGVSVGLALPGFTERNMNEIKLAYRDEYLCKFFMHIRVSSVRTATVHIDCVKVEDIRTLEKKYASVLKVGGSDHVYLRDFQRIRVDVSGSSYREKESENLENRFVYFFASSEKNHLNFKINQQQRMGLSPSTSLKFSIDNGPKRVVIHQQDFDPWTLPIGDKTEAGQRRVNKITRGSTMLDLYKS